MKKMTDHELTRTEQLYFYNKFKTVNCQSMTITHAYIQYKKKKKNGLFGIKKVSKKVLRRK